MYDLDTGDYKEKMMLNPGPKWMRGIACYDGHLYVTSDDRDADDLAPDHMYRIDPSQSKETGTVLLEKTFDDVIMQGEIEGLSFDKERGQFLLLFNREQESLPECLLGFMKVTAKRSMKCSFMI